MQALTLSEFRFFLVMHPHIWSAAPSTFSKTSSTMKLIKLCDSSEIFCWAEMQVDALWPSAWISCKPITELLVDGPKHLTKLPLFMATTCARKSVTICVEAVTESLSVWICIDIALRLSLNMVTNESEMVSSTWLILIWNMSTLPRETWMSASPVNLIDVMRVNSAKASSMLDWYVKIPFVNSFRAPWTARSSS